MKKYFCGVVCLMFLSGMANAEDFGSAMQKLFLEQVRIQTPIYQKMLTCTPAKSEALEVFGIKNGKCHIFNQGVTCYLPLDVSKKFAQMPCDHLTISKTTLTHQKIQKHST